MLPRPGEEGQATTDAATYGQDERPTTGADVTNLTKEAADYDDAVEAAGVLNRLDLLNF
ncbi:hypothetical protein [Paraflavitalea speifideaquila]|uniref:hypothetical protein n=1 Tax=Paraflavitalea speifideaquila TaxID=3076558 RepID=UPI0028E464FF|nr:hypothetical protein [Paraflavitalea speifideiaquila]